MGAQLTHRRATSIGDHGGFLAGIAERQVTGRPTRLKQVKRRPGTLSDAEVQQVLDACERSRDRLPMALMFETGCRIRQALGLRHEDINTDRRSLTLRPRDNNANRARGKSRDPEEIPVRQTLLDLYTDYLFGEYGELDCDYVFREPVERDGRCTDEVLGGDDIDVIRPASSASGRARLARASEPTRCR
ncbi:tyrosine-type recombinase/integrase [Streptomyces sp. NPDC003006]